MRRAILLTGLLVGLASAASAQTGESQARQAARKPGDAPTSIVPRSVPPYAPTKPWWGKRLPDGQPALPQGIWRTVEPQTRYIDVAPPGQVMTSRVVDPPDGLIPYQPWAREMKK